MNEKIYIPLKTEFEDFTVKLPNEQWKDIEGYEGFYQISNYGRVFSCLSGRIRKTSINNKGYEVVHLYKNAADKSFTIHFLVAKAFVPNTFLYKEINHKDENKTNNYYENLEWCSRKYNQEYSGNIKKWSIAGAKGNKEASSKKVCQYDLAGNFLKEYSGLRELERLTGFMHQGVGKVCRGKQKTAYGFIWKFCDICDRYGIEKSRRN